LGTNKDRKSWIWEHTHDTYLEAEAERKKTNIISIEERQEKEKEENN
jgi:hypothetical protein